MSPQRGRVEAGLGLLLRPGRRAVISTNGAFAMRRIYELHTAAARELGFDPLPITPGHFTMDDLPLVQRVFPTAERYVLEGALVFDTADPALRFYASNRIDALRDAHRTLATVRAYCRPCASGSRRSSSERGSSRLPRALAISSPRLTSPHPIQPS